jgi:hypothetical protein
MPAQRLTTVRFCDWDGSINSAAASVCIKRPSCNLADYFLRRMRLFDLNFVRSLF